MGAKRKLNSIHFVGLLAIAGLVGLATESFWLFVIAFVSLLAASYHAGDIRR